MGEVTILYKILIEDGQNSLQVTHPYLCGTYRMLKLDESIYRITLRLLVSILTY